MALAGQTKVWPAFFSPRTGIADKQFPRSRLHLAQRIP
jgi:hypothetical protein